MTTRSRCGAGTLMLPGWALIDSRGYRRPYARPVPRPVVIVQARAGSTRLPRKVLADLCGRPMLAWLIERLKRHEVVVATTTDDIDDPVEALATAEGARVFRGHPTDVLRRYADAAAWADADPVVRISGDCPFIDARTVELVLDALPGADLAQNHRGAPWPFGLAVEALTRDALDRLDALAVEPPHREHVTLGAYELATGLRIATVACPPELAAPD